MITPRASAPHARRHARWLAALLVGAASCGVDLGPRAEVRDEWKRSYAIDRQGTFEIHNTNGRIRVEPSDGATIEVVATRIVRAPSEAQAKNALADLKIEEQVSTSRIVLDTTDSLGFAFFLNRSKRVDFVARVPRTVNVSLDSTNGDIEVQGLGGTFRGETTNGRVEASGLEGAAVVETTNGDVRLDFARLADGGIQTSTTNGSIRILLPRDAKANLSARLTNGSISTSDFTLTTTEQSRRRLAATLNGGGPAVRLETTNGSIHIGGR